MFFVCLVASNRQLIAFFFERIVNYFLLLLLLFFNLHDLTKFQGEKHDNKKFQGDKGDGLSIGQQLIASIWKSKSAWTCLDPTKIVFDNL